MKVLYFAWLRERVGIAEEDLDLPDGVTDVAGLIEWMKTRGGGFEKAFTEMSMVRTAVNQVHVEPSHRLGNGDEVAFFPPVTGGSV
ncbi:MAG: molybdopterin converting factor subunit 1 [Rhodospirillaceae bacterium]|nr:molybdopterin converting factor subunit 1 [Rhodospirillaceae bacterium]